MKTKELRHKFFDFFKKHGHEQVSSSSLIPAQDPTLLFANAGMNQFKDLFLGKEKRSYNKAVTIQKCVRAGGKHNDLDNVGFTKRHLTFFEMMGNFSFGDYFKKDAIRYAWEFLTKELDLPIEKLHVSVFETDDDAYNIWKDEMGVDPKHIHRLGAADNFWQMGDTGPCGPCTEIYIDRGPENGCGNADCAPGCDCDRFLELWNLVFMQYDRQPNGTDKNLTQTGVDTGMGLERVAAVLQGKDSVYETDIFMPIINHISKVTGIDYTKQTGELKAAFQVLADHIRSSSLLIADGCAPSNDGRGYVLRKIIRRAALFAQKLSDDQQLFPNLSTIVIQELGEVYPTLKTKQKLIKEVLKSEIDKFATNLVRGKQILQKYMDEHQDSKLISGEQAFKMYDTYGFPTELTELIANEHDFTVDMEEFATHMAQQKAQSGKKTTDPFAHIKNLDEHISSEFTGYNELETTSNIIALVHDFESVEHVAAGNTAFVIAKKSPFFIVGGGQVPDNGWLTIGDKKIPIKSVRYIKKGIAAEIETPVDIKVGDAVISTVHEKKRIDAMKNHTATHLLQAALMQLFGNQIKQSGSLVHPDYLRFDFTYHTTLTEAQIKKVEDIVNEKIRANIPVDITQMTYRDAIKMGALAFFGDKYNPENVRVVNVPDFSVELCGGTHVPRTGDIGTFKITQEIALAAGHRRIFAITGPKAINLYQETFNTVKNLSQLFKVKHEQVLQTVEKLNTQHKELQKELKKTQQQLLQTQMSSLIDQIEMINNVPFLFTIFKDMPIDTLKESMLQLANKKSGFYFFGSEGTDRVTFVATMSDELADHLDIKKFSTWLKKNANLRGGGSKNILQGGGATFDANLKKNIIQWIIDNN
ncbi:MAG: alanine--tRNA ligase [Candidatus Dependentiae bacterium]